MNMLVRPQKKKSSLRRPRTHNEFLPAALEILETPASPLRIVFIWFVAVVVASALLWSYFGTFDIVATAQGKIQPTGRVKVVQSTETGRTLSPPLANGTRVLAGQLLVQLDETELMSDELGIRAERDSLNAEIMRRGFSIANARRWQTQLARGTHALDADLANVSTHLGAREAAIYEADLSQLQTALINIAAQESQQKATIDRLERTIEAQSALVRTLGERVSIHAALINQSAGTRSALIDATEAQQKEQAVLAEQKGQLIEAQASLVVAASEIQKSISSFVADNTNRRGDAERRTETLEQQLIKAHKRRQAMRITSPIAGIVQASSITAVGQVVTAGAELMRVVPDGGALEVEAYLPNRDIGFVAKAQSAVVKVEAFPFTRYGTINGAVVAVARDAIPEPDAGQLEGSPTRPLQSVVPVTNAQRIQNLVFPVTVRLKESSILVDDETQQLSPGMSVTVEIRTGQRRILEYLFSPLAEIAGSAMKER